MKTDSILKTPLRNGITLERTITTGGAVKIAITGPEDEVLFSEDIAAPGGADAAQEPELVL